MVGPRGPLPPGGGTPRDRRGGPPRPRPPRRPGREGPRFDHRAWPGAPDWSSRRARPHHLVPRRTRWCPVAWGVDRDDWRTLRVGRLGPRTPGGPRRTPRELPGGDVSALVTSRFGGNDGTGTDGPCRGAAVLRPTGRRGGVVRRGRRVEEGSGALPARPRLLVVDRTRHPPPPVGRRVRGLVGRPRLTAAFADLAPRGPRGTRRRAARPPGRDRLSRRAPGCRRHLGGGARAAGQCRSPIQRSISSATGPASSLRMV
ncbi:WYL domain-containing protein [Streptomyces sp. DSM 44915]|uniref:WYL domain-containing protein n=1 Tax=Streptomyces chisholmiae TaxID=3075540 RepID=A0ABU2K0P5_9ACTN|nr:WYL domain-containing protein [Streptomyces sp. DSM 44915]MDT0270821.1 WYL domain-containing protein [Streptomyces sp. DSM 44915]